MRHPLKHTWEDGEPVPLRLELAIVGTWLLLGALSWWGCIQFIEWGIRALFPS